MKTFGIFLIFALCFINYSDQRAIENINSTNPTLQNGPPQNPDQIIRKKRGIDLSDLGLDKLGLDEDTLKDLTSKITDLIPGLGGSDDGGSGGIIFNCNDGEGGSESGNGGKPGTAPPKPASGAPPSVQPASGAPPSGKPNTEAPPSGQPGSGASPSAQPNSEAPPTDKPTSGAPPKTQQNSGAPPSPHSGAPPSAAPPASDSPPQIRKKREIDLGSLGLDKLGLDADVLKDLTKKIMDLLSGGGGDSQGGTNTFNCYHNHNGNSGNDENKTKIPQDSANPTKPINNPVTEKPVEESGCDPRHRIC